MRNGTGVRAARRPALPALLAVLTIGVAGCGATTEGKPQTIGDVAGLPVTHFESGLKPKAPEPDLQVRNGTGSKADELATAAIADVSDYWAQQMPAHFGQEFKPVKALLSYDPTGDGIEVCGSTTSEAGMNAFYCPSEDLVAWDRAKLLPLLDKKFGPMAIVSVLGHEFGHAIQYRLGEKAGITENTKTIVKEQQADCFTGSYFRWMAEDNSQYFKVSTSEGINQILAALFFIRDKPGQSASRPGAHGTAFDRTYAFQLGFENGAKRCAEINMPKVEERITEQPFHSEDDEEGYSRLTEKTVGSLKKSLDTAFQRTGTQPPRIVAGDAGCQNGPGTPPASYCPGTNTVHIDLGALAEIGQPLTRGSSSGGLGDFAAYAEIASRYVLAVQQGVGLSLDDQKAGLRTACLVGAWAGFANSPSSKLRLSSGDLDEAIAELLQPHSLIAADVNGHRVANGFARVEALRQGYLNGSGPCTTTYA